MFILLLTIGMLFIVASSAAFVAFSIYSSYPKGKLGEGANISNNANEMTPPMQPDDNNNLIRKIGFGIFMVNYDDSAIDLLTYRYGNHTRESDGVNDYVIQSIRVLKNSTSIFDAFPEQTKMIIVQSLDNITDAQALGNYSNVTTLTYDVEHWPNTPESERRHLIGSVEQGATAVHTSGYKYGITPDATYLIDNYKKIKWQDVDFVGMQLQRFSQNLEIFTNYTKNIASFIRSENPHTEIFVQLSCRFTDAEQTIKAIESVKDSIDGVIFAYVPNSSDPISKMNCTPQNLDKVIGSIVEIRVSS